jgi:hypothetical protein
MPKYLLTFIQVVISFGISAGSTLICTILCLLFARSSEFTYNWVDYNARKFIELVRRDRQTARRERIAECLRDVITSLSDTQLVTGIAILVAALKKLGDGSITIYHFNIVTDLAWFSSNTHILSLLVVRSFSDSAKPQARKTDGSSTKFVVWLMIQLPSFIRAALMLVLAVLLFYASWVAGYQHWYDDLRCPANCILNSSIWRQSGLPKRWMAVNFFYILWSYPIALLMLIRDFRLWWMDHIRTKLIDKQSLGSRKTENIPDFRSIHDIYQKGLKHVFLFVWYFFSSELITVLESCVWFSLGCWWLRTDRANGHNAMDPDERTVENAWEFGQLVPIMLLLLPVLQFFESFASEYGKTMFRPNTDFRWPYLRR